MASLQSDSYHIFSFTVWAKYELLTFPGPSIFALTALFEISRSCILPR